MGFNDGGLGYYKNRKANQEIAAKVVETIGAEMPDLDKKLHDLLYEQAKSYYFEGSSPQWFEEECPELIKKFKQAFVDAGYVKLHGKGAFDALYESMELMQQEFMTGREWYDRFKEEFGDTYAFGDVSKDAYIKAKQAAKKAAGLES